MVRIHFETEFELIDDFSIETADKMMKAAIDAILLRKPDTLSYADTQLVKQNI